MYFRLLMFAILVTGGYYIFWVRTREPKTLVSPTPPPILKMESPKPVLTAAEIEKVHAAAKDSDAGVRWAAIELMYRINDPLVFKYLQDTLSLDYEPAVRQKALILLEEAAKNQAENRPTALNNMLIALKDSDKKTRVAALLALGQVGDRRTIPQITDMVSDIDSDVRLQALHTLTQLQEKRRADYQKLTQELKNDYKLAAQRAAQQNKPRDYDGTGYPGSQ